MYTGANTKQSKIATGSRLSTMYSQPVDKLTQVKSANTRTSNQIARSLHSNRGQNDFDILDTDRFRLALEMRVASSCIHML